MLLGEVLSVLMGPLKSRYTNKKFYLWLFEGIDVVNTKEDPGIDQYVKKVFSKRSFRPELLDFFMEQNGFEELVFQVRNVYLPKIADLDFLNQKLKNLIAEDTCFTEYLKEALYDSASDATRMEYFIAACIVCGGYNSKFESSTKKNKIYNLNLSFMGNTASTKSINSFRIWQAVQKEFAYSRSKRARFYALDIKEQILPKGYPISCQNVQLTEQVEDNTLIDIIQLCKNSEKNIFTIGIGGIGKTTFLQEIMTETYLCNSKKDGIPIPIFIELSRCPVSINEWHDDCLGKTNFITRYIAQIIENHKSLNLVEEETLHGIEKEFQKLPQNNVPEYILLLDGFNEVKMSVRGILSNEISVLSEYANIRIIVTSRELKSAHFAETFETFFFTRHISVRNQGLFEGQSFFRS